MFSLKPSRDQDENNDIHYSQIGSAVFNLLSHTQTDRHRVTLVYRIKITAKPIELKFCWRLLLGPEMS